MRFERPPFFGDGVFQSNGLGYQLTAPAPPPDDAALKSRNSWLRLAAVLQRAKAGDFRSLPVLIGCLRESDSWVLSKACAQLMGDAGSPTFLAQVAAEFDADLFELDHIVFQTELASTFALSGLLWTVPVLVRIYEKIARESDGRLVPLLLSQLLEPRFDRYCNPDTDVSVADYRKLVLDKHGELLEKYKSENTPIYAGEVFGVRAVAERLYDRLRRPGVLDVYVARDRHRFEAATGVDCRAFFRDGSVQPLAAAAVVEEFLDSPEAEKYEPGVRYFFGHRIPA